MLPDLAMPYGALYYHLMKKQKEVKRLARGHAKPVILGSTILSPGVDSKLLCSPALLYHNLHPA